MIGTAYFCISPPDQLKHLASIFLPFYVGTPISSLDLAKPSFVLVGLINSIDDLSGPDVSSAVLSGDHESNPATKKSTKWEQRRKQTAVGTPGCLTPEILLEMPHDLLF